MRSGNILSLISISALLAISGIWWDGWWHVTMGRDSMWIAPHLLQYINVIILVASSFYLYLKTKEKLYRNMLIALGIFVLMAPSDEIWHHLFGYEDLTTPLAIWSPPHLIAILANLITILLLLFYLIEKHKPTNSLSFLRIVLLSSACLSMINFIIIPLQPFGWHFVLGSWGVIITISVSMLYILIIASKLPNTGIVLFMTLSLLVFIGFKGTTPAPNIILPNHAIPPLWLNFMALVPVSFIFDFIDIRKYNPIILGGLGGFLVYFIYWIFWNFIELPKNFFDQSEAFILVIMATVGGMVAGAIFILIKKRWKEFFI